MIDPAQLGTQPLTVTQAAALTRVSPSAVRNWIASGKLQWATHGLLAASDVLAAVRDRRHTPKGTQRP